MNYITQLKNSAKRLQSLFGNPPKLGIIFGSGLGTAFLKEVKVLRSVKFSKIPNFMTTTVEGHRGEVLHIKTKSGALAFVLQGRSHYYEGISPEQVVLPLRVLIMWGIKDFIITNSSGSLNPKIRPGDLVWIKDHLNFTGANPLRGSNLEFLGPRFPSLIRAYQNPFSEKIRRVAKRLKVPLKPAVYVGIAGPSYETPAEIIAFKKLGGDIVGMSTVLEVIAAAHADKMITALAAVTNNCLNLKKPLNHREVLTNAKRVDLKLAKLLLGVLKEYHS